MNACRFSQIIFLLICALEVDKKQRLQIFASVVFLLISCDFIVYFANFCSRTPPNQKFAGCSSSASVPPGLSVLLGSKYALSALNTLSCSLPIEPSRKGAKSLPMP